MDRFLDQLAIAARWLLHRSALIGRAPSHDGPLASVRAEYLDALAFLSQYPEEPGALENALNLGRAYHGRLLTVRGGAGCAVHGADAWEFQSRCEVCARADVARTLLAADGATAAHGAGVRAVR